MVGGQGIDHLVEGRSALEQFVQPMHGKADAVIGDASLWKIIRPDAL
jgi:hypothetical protein